jgi:hypothetical protein
LLGRVSFRDDLPVTAIFGGSSYLLFLSHRRSSCPLRESLLPERSFIRKSGRRRCKLAREFRISDVGPAKLCRRHKIPLPGRGYWTRIQFGQNQGKNRLCMSQGYSRRRPNRGCKSLILRPASILANDSPLESHYTRPFRQTHQFRPFSSRPGSTGDSCMLRIYQRLSDLRQSIMPRPSAWTDEDSMV